MYHDKSIHHHSTGNMYAKQELAITLSTCPSFMFKKVVHDDQVTKEQLRNHPSKAGQQKLVWVQNVMCVYCLRCAYRTHWMELFGGYSYS